MKFVRFLVVLVTYLVVAKISIYGCSCTPEANAPACQKIGALDVVFAGTAVERIRSESEFAGTYRFRVDKVYKGLKPDTREIIVVPGAGSCSTSYSTGVPYLIFASNSSGSDRFVFSGMCHGSRVASESEVAYLDAYLEGKSETVVFGRVLQWVTSIGYPRENESAPVADAEIVLEMGQQKLSTRSGEDGSFVFHSVPPGSYFVSSTLSPFIPFRKSSPITVTKGGCYLVYPELKADGRIDGKVLDNLGKPVKDIRVELLRRNSKGEWYQTYKYWTNTKSDGTFSFKDLESGDYLVQHDSSDQSPYPRTYAPGVEHRDDAKIVTIRPRDSAEGILLRLPLRHQHRTVMIKVINEDGSVVGSNLLQVFSKNGLIRNFGGRFADRLGNDGFVFQAFAEREYQFKARYWVDDLSSVGENKRLLLAQPVTLKPGHKDAEVILRLSTKTDENDKVFWEY